MGITIKKFVVKENLVRELNQLKEKEEGIQFLSLKTSYIDGILKQSPDYSDYFSKTVWKFIQMLFMTSHDSIALTSAIFFIEWAM